jgi:tRNA-specific 2-thiouridylase
VPDNDYASLVEKRRPGEAREGKIVDPDGNVVGAHGGQHRFTIGQRRGVGVSLGYPIYVVNKDPRTNTVTVGPGEMLEAKSCVAREVNWLGDEARFAEWRECLVKIRYNAAPVAARCRVDVRGDRLEIEFESAQRAVAPGQAAVCYDAAEPDVVLGGGWIGEAR